MLGVVPPVLGMATFVLFSGAGLLPTAGLLAGIAAFAVLLAIGGIAVTWLDDERRAAYLFTIGVGLTVICGGLFLFFWYYVAPRLA